MRTVVGLFDDTNEARRTMDDLMRIGVRESDIHMITQSDRGRIDVIGSLVQAGLSETEARRYVGGLDRGYTLETASVDDDKANEALAIMRDHAPGGGETRAETRAEERAARTGEEEQLFPVIVEELEIGKRQVGTEGVRVASRVTEQPIEKEVALREEKVDVERRKVDRPVQPGDQDLAFQNREIEVTATAEEPVVRKTARVVEEVAVTKDVGTRTETIRETVRKTDVDVQKIPFEASRYRDDYEKSYAKSGGRFEDYEPAYRFGHELRQDERYANQDWSTAEPRARERWESKNPGTWDRFKAAVRHAWDKTKS